MVDETRDVAADGGVATPGAIDPEHPDAAVSKVPLFASFAVRVVSDQLAGVVDDARVLCDSLDGEDTVSVDGRTAARDFRNPGSLRHWLANRTKRSTREASCPRRAIEVDGDLGSRTDDVDPASSSVVPLGALVYQSLVALCLLASLWHFLERCGVQLRTAEALAEAGQLNGRRPL